MGRAPRGDQRLVVTTTTKTTIIMTITTIITTGMMINTPTPEPEATCRASRRALKTWGPGVTDGHSPGCRGPLPTRERRCAPRGRPRNRDVTGGCVTSESRGPFDIRRGRGAATLPRTGVALHRAKTRRQRRGCSDRAEGASPGGLGALYPPTPAGRPSRSSRLGPRVAGMLQRWDRR